MSFVETRPVDLASLSIIALVAVERRASVQSQAPPFQIEEATIGGPASGDSAGAITCRGVVQAYLDRAQGLQRRVQLRSSRRTARRFRPRQGTVRAGAPLKFPDQDGRRSRRCCPTSISTRDRRSSSGGWKPTASDPDVQQQYGMTVGMPNAGQVNALGTINVRGERSVTCKGDFDKHPSGPLPATRRRSATSSASSPMRSSGRRSSTRSTAGARTSRRCRCTASRSRSRIRSTRRTCVRPAAATRATTWISRRAITRSSRSCGRRARSSTRRRTRPNTTAAPAIRAAGTSPTRCWCRRSAISGAPGPATRRTRTTRRAPRRSARARGPACRSARTW